MERWIDREMDEGWMGFRLTAFKYTAQQYLLRYHCYAGNCSKFALFEGEQLSDSLERAVRL